MKTAQSERPSTADLDEHLRDLLHYVYDLPDTKKGVVAAAVIDTGERTFAPSAVTADGNTIHAERNAIRQYYDTHGVPSEEAWVVTTLSPCVYPDAIRVGCSCTDLLRGNDETYDTPVPRVHTGYMDPWQVGKQKYDEMGLTVSTTNNTVVRECCENLFQFFRDEQVNDVAIPSFVDDALAPLVQ